MFTICYTWRFCESAAWPKMAGNCGHLFNHLNLGII